MGEIAQGIGGLLGRIEDFISAEQMAARRNKVATRLEDNRSQGRDYGQLYQDSYLARNQDSMPASVSAMQTGQYFLPLVGEGLDFGEGITELLSENPNYATAGGLLAAAGLGLIPGAGDALAQGVGAAARGAKRTAGGLLDAGGQFGDELTNALTDFGGDDFGGAHLSLYGMPDQSGDLGRAQERVRISTPKSWLEAEAKRERGFHPASKVKMGDFDVTPKFEDRGTLLPSQSLTIEDLQGTTLTPAYGDRTRAGGILSGYDDTEFDPILMQGGQGFMREKGTGMWASEAGPMRAKAKTVVLVRNLLQHQAVSKATARLERGASGSSLDVENGELKQLLRDGSTGSSSKRGSAAAGAAIKGQLYEGGMVEGMRHGMGVLMFEDGVPCRLR